MVVTYLSRTNSGRECQGDGRHGEVVDFRWIRRSERKNQRPELKNRTLGTPLQFRL